jgi:hypothetical protein
VWCGAVSSTAWSCSRALSRFDGLARMVLRVRRGYYAERGDSAPSHGNPPPSPAANERLMPKEESFYESLVDIARRGFDKGQIEVGFHALSAAAHAAEDEERTDRLADVEQMAREELAWLNANRPDHRFASPASTLRGHQSIFDQLASTAMGMRSRINADRQRREMGDRLHRVSPSKG